MKLISISDITMKQSGRTVDFSLSFREKLELVKLLDRLGLSVIETCAIEQPKPDSLLIKSICSAVRDSTVAVPVHLDPDSVSLTWNALKEARHPRLQVPAPVSAVQMEYLAHKKPDAMLTALRETIAACRALCGEVEFIADDATRSDPTFLRQAITCAIEAGAGIITLCDTAGTMLPDEFTEFLRALYADLPALQQITLGVSCINELAMADACAFAALRCGACEVKAAAYCVNTINLGNIARLIAVKGDALGLRSSIRVTEMRRVLGQITRMCQTNRSKNSPFDNGVQSESELTLTVHDDISAILKAAATLGYDLSEEDGVKVYEAFLQIASHKDSVGSKELDAIVASAAMQVPPTYQVDAFSINTGSRISSMAHLRLLKDGTVLEGVSLGDGPIDAAFLAIEQIVGRHYELDDFQLQAITEGREAMGETIVKLRSGGKVYSGRGISTDIVGAGIHAYINALNKIVYEEAAL